MKNISIAIDGPAGAGKSTMAKRLAKEMGYMYVDTGAIYRTVGLFMTICGIAPKDADGVARLIDEVNVDIAYDDDGSQRMLLNGTDVTDDLRTPEMSDCASKISALPVVRSYLLDVQRDLAKRYNVIMDGRDIGTVVLPNADVKIFLTASAEVRAQRRFLELQAAGNKKATFQTVLEEMKQRDHRDSTRPVAPLKQAKDAVLLDTSEFSLEESVLAMKAIIEEKLGK